MNVGITSLLEKGSGPKELCAALGVKTRPLAALSRALATIKRVGSEVPPDLLGGGLLDLLSHRMRELLGYDGQPQVKIAEVPGPISRFADQSEFKPARNSTFPGNSEPGRSAAKGSGALTPALPRRHSFPAMLESPSIPVPADPVTSFEFPVAAQPHEPLLPEVSGRKRGPGPPGAGGATAPKWAREPVPSLLAEKLGEYWELNRLQQSSGKNLNRQAIPGGNNQAPGDFPLLWPPSAPIARSRPEIAGQPADRRISSLRAEASIPGGKSQVSEDLQPPWPNSAQTPRSWPEITGHQAARRISSLGAEASSHRAVQTVNSSAPDKVEIQNIFNIEIGAASSRGEGWADNLSERIADLLREQALQHGIDIT